MRAALLLTLLAACEGGGGLLDESNVFDGTTWQPGPKLLGARGGHTATLLADGTIAVLGGAAYDSAVSAQICDVAAATCEERGALAHYHESADAVLLPTGRILVSNGWNGPGELYDPTSGAVEDVPPEHPVGKLIGLPNGDVFVLYLNANAIFDSMTDTWTSVEEPPVPLAAPTLAALADGSVLASGDYGPKSAAIFTPGTGWRIIARMLTQRAGHTMTVLRDGRVLAVGGASGDDPIGAEIYDPTTDAWTAAGDRDQNRRGHAAALLDDGRVLVTGGVIMNLDYPAMPTATIFDPNTGAWEPSSELPWRQYHPIVALPGDRAIVLGGDTGYMDGRSAD